MTESSSSKPSSSSFTPLREHSANGDIPTLYSTFHKQSIQKSIDEKQKLGEIPTRAVKQNSFQKLLSHIPPIKYRFGREAFKFGWYLLYPFGVVFAISQPAIKEWIVSKMPETKSYMDNWQSSQSQEEVDLAKNMQQVELGNASNYNLYWQEKTKNDERVKKFLEMQRGRVEKDMDRND
ncbi:predicted protein [Naegleria gruberi]|uniref:Predicted protein n=1 Tax=Naegleria gruberi TaxID=5762 RepID=D2VBI6_NAEGR|nr:uncharacterized protein NAEGRDRAFT_66230 [Naegleria gruberi]EFC45913.1 predicted protein [Naegleria gruberi]|eukprot:XP_002678657.1 predicted protein [Naegleria gruberi strain NEG-M]